MVAVHQRQLLSWEEDRQKVLTLEERCSKLEGQTYMQQHLSCTCTCQHVKRAQGKDRNISTQSLLHWSLFYFLFIYLFLAELGLCCCVQAFSSCGGRGLLFVAVHGLLIAVASLLAEHGL